MAAPTPFKIAVSQDLLEWITNRVKTARLPPGKDLPADQAWSYGLPADVAAKLHEFWVNKYSWRTVEAKLNKELQMFTLPISHGDEDLTIHFVHHRSTSSNAIPLLFLHGWPGNFLEVRDIIGELTTPSSSSAQAYHVVAPSLPGFGFSSCPSKPFNIGQFAGTMNKLMLALGYPKYMCQGGDWGSVISRTLAVEYSQYCVGIHLNHIFAPLPSPFRAPFVLARLLLQFGTGWWDDYDGKIIKRMLWWQKSELGFQEIQGTKPLTISYALNDSPFGMMCWIRDKLNNRNDDDFTWEDELVITWAMIYILNGTSGHADIYKYALGEGLEDTKKYIGRVIGKHVPIGVSVFPRDSRYATRWWAEAMVGENITFWKAHDKGGHFASVEKPTQLIEDIRGFTAVSDIANKIYRS